jgi:hypothetical protein
MRFIGDQDRLVTALEKVPAAAVAPVEVIGIARVEPMHGGGQVGLGGPQEKMVMVVHQTKRKQVNVEPRAGISHQGQEFLSIVVISKNLLPIVAP